MQNVGLLITKKIEFLPDNWNGNNLIEKATEYHFLIGFRINVIRHSGMSYLYGFEKEVFYMQIHKIIAINLIDPVR